MSDGAVQVSFSLDDEEAAGVRVELRGGQETYGSTRWLRWLFLVGGILQTVHAVLSWIAFNQRPTGHWRVDALLASFVALLFLAQAFFYDRYPRVRRTVDLTFGDSITGTIDGKPVSYAWRDVRFARDLGSVLVLSLGAFTSVAIPKNKLAGDGARLWAMLEDRMTAKRGLVATPNRTYLLNSAR